MVWNTDPMTSSSDSPRVLGSPAPGTGGNCQVPASGSALNRPSEMATGLAFTGMPTAEVRARSLRSMACRPSGVTSHSRSPKDANTASVGLMGSVSELVTNGIDISAVLTFCVDLPRFTTVSHSAQSDEAPVTGVAYGAPGIPIHCPLDNLF